MTTISVPFFMGEAMGGFEVPGADHILRPHLPGEDPMVRMGALYEALAHVISLAEQPLVFAGDCCSIIGVLAGLQRRTLDPTLVFFDAHGDFNTWDTTPSGFVGGMPLAMVVGRGEQTIAEAAGLRSISESRVTLVGARDLDPGEREAIDGSALTVLDVAAMRGPAIPAGPLYVHVDVDVVDPSEMPAVNYPAPGGPSLDEVRLAIDALIATGRVVALSFSCWNPKLESAATAAAATVGLAGGYLAS